MKKVLLFAACAALFAACSSDDLSLGNQPQPKANAQAEEAAIGFDAYIERGVTRSGVKGDYTSAQLADPGFGVFAYYTNNIEYDQQATPNFMYNQLVKKETSGAYTYSPVKYWPNEYGSSAVSEDADKVSFFAYAPYVEVVPSSGKLTCRVDSAQWGITGLTRNTATGDPMVKYVVSFDTCKTVDLVWGVVPDESASTSWKITNGYTTKAMDANLPWLNTERPDGTQQKLKFQFKHATAKLNVQIDYDKDILGHQNSETKVGTETKVYVRSIKFTGFATKGALNLNNNEPNKAYWFDYNGKAEADLLTGEDVIIYDGRKDGKEGVDGAEATNEKLLGLNDSIISNNGNTSRGVINELQNLFKSIHPDASIYVIPTGDPVTVEIEYDIETIDNNLPNLLSDGKNYGSSVPNRISKEISFGTGDDNKIFKNGQAYTIRLHLGLNDVQFDADVTEWTTPSAANPFLPAN